MATTISSILPFSLTSRSSPSPSLSPTNLASPPQSLLPLGLEITLHLLTFAPFLPKTAEYLSRKTSTARGFPWHWMLLHLFSSCTLLVRYYTSALRSQYVAGGTVIEYDSLNVILGLLFVLSSFGIEESRRSKHSPVYRAAFRAAILMHAAVFGMSWLEKDVALYVAGVKFLTWFASFRIVLRLLVVCDPSLRKPANYKRMAEIAVLGSAGYSVWYAGLPVGVWSGLVGVLLVLDKVVLGGKGTSVVKDEGEGEGTKKE